MIRLSHDRTITALAAAVALLLGLYAPVVARTPAEGCYFEGIRLVEAGRTKPAVDMFRQAIIAPQVNMGTAAYRHIAHRRELMQLLINEGVSGEDPSFNIEKFHQALVARAYTRIAEILMADGQFEEAMRELARAQLADPEYPMAACRLAQAQLATGNPSAAIKHAKAAWLSSPLYAEYRRTYATAVARNSATLYRQGETGKARLSFEFGLQIDPLNPETLSDYGWLLFSGKEKLPFRVSEEAELAIRRYTRSRALYMMQQAAELAPEVAVYHLQLGRAYRLTGEDDRAAECFQRSGQAEPANVDAQLGAARALLDGGDPNAALEHLREAEQRRPSDPEVLTALAGAYRAKGDMAQAVRRAQEAIALDANYAQAHYELGLSHLARGDESQAILELQRARAIASDDHLGLLARARLVQLGASES